MRLIVDQSRCAPLCLCRNDAGNLEASWPATTITTVSVFLRSTEHDAKRQGSNPRHVLFSRRSGRPSHVNATRRVLAEVPVFASFCSGPPAWPRKPDAGAEGHLAGGTAADVERVGLSSPARVAVLAAARTNSTFSPSRVARRDRAGPGRAERVCTVARSAAPLQAPLIRFCFREAAPLFGIASPMRRARCPVHRRWYPDAGRKTRAHQHAGFVFRQLAGIDAPKIFSPTSRGQRRAAAFDLIQSRRGPALPSPGRTVVSGAKS